MTRCTIIHNETGLQCKLNKHHEGLHCINVNLTFYTGMDEDVKEIKYVS